MIKWPLGRLGHQNIHEEQPVIKGVSPAFIKVLTVNIYKIRILSNIQTLTLINISNCEESL
jgi:hypothetical protein